MAPNPKASEFIRLMDAAWDAVKPWWEPRLIPCTIELEGEEKTVLLPGVRPDAPEEIKRLATVCDELEHLLPGSPTAGGSYVDESELTNG